MAVFGTSVGTVPNPVVSADITVSIRFTDIKVPFSAGFGDHLVKRHKSFFVATQAVKGVRMNFPFRTRLS